MDVPLLLEKGLDTSCDVIVYVDTSRVRRAERACESRGWDRTEVARRERSQKSVNFKRKRADYIVNNNLSKGRTFRQVREIWSLVTSTAIRSPSRRGRPPVRASGHRARGECRATHERT